MAPPTTEGENPHVRPPPPRSPAPAYPPSGSREPDWTTGQGIGFLVALPGWMIVGLTALVGVTVVAAGTSGSWNIGAPELLVLVGPALFGVVIAIPGTIVFNKCKRR